jgi:sulfur-oxidizing protein SoxY
MTDQGASSVSRRLVVAGAGSVALAGFGVFSLAVPTALAANDKYPDEAFKQKDDKEAVKLLYGRTAEPSDKIKLDAPEIAENGAVVPVSVSTSLADVTSIAFVVPENPNVLAAYYRIPQGTIPSVANRLKMAKTTNVTVIVESGGKLFSASREVKVTVGGCGG